MSNIIINSHYFEIWYRLADLRESTKNNYKTPFRKFGKFIESSGFNGNLDFDRFYHFTESNEFTPLDKEFIDDFVEALKEDHSDNSIYIVISALKNFFSFLYGLGMIELNPMQFYDNPFYVVIIRNRALSHRQSRLLLNAAYDLDPFFKSFAILFLLGITCGLRANEIIHLRRSQINFERGIIFINRGHKTQAKSVAMTVALKEALRVYFNHPYWIKWCQGEDKEVFFYEDQVLTYSTLRSILDLICKKANVNYNVTPHQLRHTMAHLMQQKGIHISLIQKQLRHKRLSTTLRYLGLDPSLSNNINKNASSANFEKNY